MNRPLQSRVLLLICLTFVTSACRGGPAHEQKSVEERGERETSVSPKQLSWGRKKGRSLSLNGPNGEIWRFRYAESYGKPHFHPVSTVDGPPLTWVMPPDHVWHYGLWFSWKTINGVNYWEENKKTGKASGRTSWSNVSCSTRKNGSARITLDLTYHEPGKDPVLTEKRTIEIGPPRKGGSYTMDWNLKFQAGDGEVKLDRTPLPGENGGQPWGGYAGLSFRFAKNFQNRKLVTENGPVSFESTPYARTRANGADLNGTVDGAPAGVTILGHPSNPRYPVPWYAIRKGSFGFLNAAIIQYEPMTLNARETMTLRYRLIIHPERWTRNRIQQAVNRYVP